MGSAAAAAAGTLFELAKLVNLCKGRAANLRLDLRLVISPGLGVGDGGGSGLDAGLGLGGVARNRNPFLGLGQGVIVALVPLLASSVAGAAGGVNIRSALDVLLGVAVGDGDILAGLDLVHGGVGDGGVSDRLGGGLGLDSGLLVGALVRLGGSLNLGIFEKLAEKTGPFCCLRAYRSSEAARHQHRRSCRRCPQSASAWRRQHSRRRRRWQAEFLQGRGSRRWSGRHPPIGVRRQDGGTATGPGAC